MLILQIVACGLCYHTTGQHTGVQHMSEVGMMALSC